MKSKKPISHQSDVPIKSEQVLILPGHMFFVEPIDVPKELEVSEIPDFAELSLESVSPFPTYRVYWGYLYREDVSTLLLYAARLERIKSEGYTDLEEYAWVMPDFATLAGAVFHNDTFVLLEGDGGVSMAYFEKNTEIPRAVWLDTTDEPMTESVVQSLRAGIRDLPQTVPTLHLRPVVASVSENGIPTFEHAASEQNGGRGYDGNWQSLTPSEAHLWQMDVRAAEFKTVEQSKRRISALILRISGWAAIFAMLLLVAEGFLFEANNWLNKQLNKIEDQRVAVAKVEEKQILVNKLEQVAQNELRPIEMLEAANNVRLKLNLGIEYDEVVIEGDNHITIEGKAISVNAINRYMESLKSSGMFELLGTPKTPTTRSGKTTFRISLAYIPKITPEESSAPDISEPAATEPFQSAGEEET